MSMLVWDQIGERFYETGVDRGVLYPRQADGEYNKGVAWSGLININENPSGAEATPVYADNIQYLNLIAAEKFGCTIEAYYSPEEFDACDGSIAVAGGVYIGQQTRQVFGLSYRSLIGNDTEGTDHGYKLHLVYGGTAAPSQKNRSTVNETPEAMTLSWEVSTTPVAVPGFKPTAHLVIDSTKADATKLAALEGILYGSGSEDARLPMPEEVIELMGGAV